MLRREDFTRKRVEEIGAAFRALGLPDPPYVDHEARDANRRRVLGRLRPGEDLWIFGYGSLMWNPAFEHDDHVPATLWGYHRRFCLHMTLARGSPECPGLMLGLDRGGMCHGLALRIPASRVHEETDILWMREMIAGTYEPRWVPLRLATRKGAVGASVPARPQAVTFTVNRAHPRYTGRLPIAEVARRIATASGELGSCREYFEETIAHVRSLGLRDRHLEDIARALEAFDRSGGG